MKKDETAKTTRAATKEGVLTRTVGSTFTADAKETEAIIKSTVKIAVNWLNRLSPARLTQCFLIRVTGSDAATVAKSSTDWELTFGVLVIGFVGNAVVVFVLRYSR